MRRIGQELCSAAFVAFSGKLGTEVPGVLRDELAARKDEVVDYCLRVYHGTRESFAVDPAADHEARCSQVSDVSTVVIISMDYSNVYRAPGGGRDGRYVVGGF
jgi:hypothetical protein